MKQWYHRWAPSLGALESTPEKVWGTKPYDPLKHTNERVVFCGLYGLPDFFALWRHKGEKHIWWAGTDIQHFKEGYWLDEKGTIRIQPKQLADWINHHCQSWVENEHERAELQKAGIHVPVSHVIPSFLGDTQKIKVCYKPSKQVQTYASVSSNNFKMYGWDRIEAIAGFLPGMTFHLYGNTKPWKTEHKNVIVHGRVPKEQMNREIQSYQIGLRLNEWDGFSEILAKAVLMGQYAIGKIAHPHIPSYKTNRQLISLLKTLSKKQSPNIQVREWYMKNLNLYPWAK